jgi:hypothetical protein
MVSEKHCEQALDLHGERLFRMANVVGLGVVSADEDVPAGDNLAVAVYVEEKRPLEELAEKDRIPRTLEVQDEEGSREIPVRVIVQGHISLEEVD